MRGFSFIEVVVSLFIIGTVIVLSSAILKAAPLSRHAKFENLALSIAQNELEGLRAAGYSSLPAAGSFSDPLLSSLPSGSGSLSVSDFNAKAKQVAVTVSWREEASSATSSVSLSTLISSVGGLK
jgi:prepilin-type N-terminal cleavage/methylation domain-containing protein